MARDDGYRSSAGGVECRQLSEFLRGDPEKISTEAGLILLRHAARCEQCGDALKTKDAHAQRLMGLLEDIGSPMGGVSLIEHKDQLIRAAQYEFAQHARGVFERLDPDVLDQIARSSASTDVPAAFSHLTAGELENPVVRRLAIGYLETVFVLSSLIGGDEGTLSSDCDFRVGTREIPAEYFESLVEKATGVASPAIWRAMVQQTIAGAVGMPGLHATARSGSDGVLLTVVRDSVPED